MAGFFEPRGYRERREQRDAELYPELQFSDPAELMRIDAANIRDNQPVTSFAQTHLNTFARLGVPPEERQEIERETQRDLSFINQPDNYLSDNNFRAPREAVEPDFRSYAEVYNEYEAARSQTAGIEPEGGGFDLGGFAKRAIRATDPASIVTSGLDSIRDIATGNFGEPAGEVIQGLQDIDTVTGLPLRTAIRHPAAGVEQAKNLATGNIPGLIDSFGQSSDTITQQYNREQEGGIGFGLEGSGPANLLQKVPGLENDLVAGLKLPEFLGGGAVGIQTDISAFDATLGVADILLDVGGLAGAVGAVGDFRRVPEALATVKANSIRSIFPDLSDEALLPLIRGGATPTLVDPAMATRIAIGPAAQNAAATAARTGGVGSESLRTLDAAHVIVQQDKPGAIGQFLNTIPGIKHLRAFDQPRFNLPDDILEATVARPMAVGEYATRSLVSRELAYRSLDDAFGEGAAEGGIVAVKFLGDDDAYPAIGTVYDIFQRPDLYDITDAQRAVIREIDARNLDLRTLANDGYGTDIGRFVSGREGSTYLPNVNASDAARELEEITSNASTRSVAGTSSKPRVWDTGYDRWVNDTQRAVRGELDEAQVFVPNTDIRQLLSSLDSQKANAVGTAVWRDGMPGRTLVEAKESVAPQLVEARDSLRRQIDALRGKIRRAEQSVRSDGSTATALERQIAENDARISRTIAQAEKLEDGLPELDALRGLIDELEIRQASLNRAIAGPSARTSAQSVRIDGLREELANVLDEFNDVRAAYGAVNLQGQVFVGEGLYRYVPAEQAAQIHELARVSNNKIVQLMSEINAGVLSGDLSPMLGIHGQLAFLTRPVDTTVKALKGLADPAGSTRLGNLVDEMAADPEGWANFSFWRGRPPTGTRAVPEELGGGLLRHIPGYSELNEGVYRVAMKRMKDDFEWFAQKAIADGATPDEAYAASIDVVTKVFPEMNPARLGQSAAQATAQRAPFTSIAFLRQPAALVQEGVKALIKTPFAPLTLREQFAREAVLRIVGTATATIATASYMDAELKGIDKTDHIKQNLLQARVPIPGTEFSFPIGATFRGIYNAVRPRDTEVAGLGEIPLPFAGIPAFFKNRIAPVIQTQIELRENEDYFGNETRPGDFPINILNALKYEVQGAAPITVQGVAENVQNGASGRVIAAEAAGDILGGSLTAAPDFVQEQQSQDSIARGQEWTDPQTGEVFKVDNFDQLSARLGGVVAEQMVTEASNGSLTDIQDRQREENIDEATGIDDPSQAYAQLDAIGQERYSWAQSIQAKIDRGELTLADARRLEKDQAWGAQQAGVIRSFAPVFGEVEPIPMEKLGSVTDANEVRAQYFAYMDQYTDPDSGKPSEEFYDKIQPQFIAAIGESMWARVESNLGVRDRAPWQLELKQIREDLADKEFFDIRDVVWEDEATKAGLDLNQYPDVDALETEIRRDLMAGGYDEATAIIRAKARLEDMGIYSRWSDRSNRLEEIFIRLNPDLAADAIRAGYITPGSLRSSEATAIANR